MTDIDAPVASPTPSGGKLPRTLQWIVFLVLLLAAAINLIPLEYRNAPGFPEVLFWASLACGFALALMHLPNVFFRLSRRLKISAYAVVLPALIFSLTVLGYAAEVYDQTPAGKIEKAKRDAADALAAKDAAERANVQRSLAQAEKSRAELEAYADKVEGCFSTFGHRLTDLEERVKSTLHNPDAFEHVKTVAVFPDAQGNNVVMQFRAENGFGALRLATVGAKLDADSCKVVDVGQAEISD